MSLTHAPTAVRLEDSRAGDYAILLRFQGKPDMVGALGVVTVAER